MPSGVPIGRSGVPVEVGLQGELLGIPCHYRQDMRIRIAFTFLCLTTSNYLVLVATGTTVHSPIIQVR